MYTADGADPPRLLSFARRRANFRCAPPPALLRNVGMSPDNTNAERQARWRAKRDKELAELRALRNAAGQAKGDAALAKELKARIAEVEQQRDTALAERATLHKMLDDGHHVIAEAKAILAAKAFMPADVFKQCCSYSRTRIASPIRSGRFLPHRVPVSQRARAHAGQEAAAAAPARTPAHHRRIDGSEVACAGRAKGQARGQARSEEKPAQVARPSMNQGVEQ